MLLEALIAVIIFSMGILALAGLQARAAKQSADAKLRSDAAYLVSQILSQVWIDRSNADDYVHYAAGTLCNFSGTAAVSNTNVVNWLGSVSATGTVLGTLPNASTQITVENSGAGGAKLVTATVCWRTPQETETHNFTSSTVISG